MEFFVNRSSPSAVSGVWRLLAVAFLIALAVIGLSLFVAVDNTGISLVGPAGVIVGVVINDIAIALCVLALAALTATAAPNSRGGFIRGSSPPLTRNYGFNVWKFVANIPSFLTLNYDAGGRLSIFAGMYGVYTIDDDNASSRPRGVARIVPNVLHAFSRPSPNVESGVIGPALCTSDGSIHVPRPNGSFGALARL